MATPVVAGEVNARLGTNDDSQSVKVREALSTLLEGTSALGEILDSEDWPNMILIKDHQDNHTRYYTSFGSVKGLVRSSIQELLAHSMVIGELATHLLQQSLGYVNMLYRDGGRPSELALELLEQTIERAQEFLSTDITLHTTD